MDRIRRRDAVGSILIVALIIAIFPSASHMLMREAEVTRSEQRVTDQTRRIEIGLGEKNAAADTFHGAGNGTGADHSGDAGYPARARISDALYIARLAQLSKSPTEQKAGLDRALRELQIVQAERPYWGEARTVAAFVHALRDGEDAGVTRQTIAQSYSDAPYLRYAAAWRVQYGLRYWDDFGPVTRGQIIDEAVWLTRLDGRSRDEVFALARNSSAYKPFVLSALAARHGDADFQPNERPSPQQPHQ